MATSLRLYPIKKGEKNYHSLKVDVLKAELRKKNLKVSGNKRKLVERLQESDLEHFASIDIRNPEIRALLIDLFGNLPIDIEISDSSSYIEEFYRLLKHFITNLDNYPEWNEEVSTDLRGLHTCAKICVDLLRIKPGNIEYRGFKLIVR